MVSEPAVVSQQAEITPTLRLMEFGWSNDEVRLGNRAEQLAKDAARRYGQYADSWINGYSKEFSRELADEGWIGMTWPAEYGGGGRHPLERLIVGEALIKAGAPIAASWFGDRQVGPTLIAHGSTDQRSHYLPSILSGEATWCIGMSEPNAGSDAAALRTTARRDRNEWVINGQKVWTSFAAVANFCYLICRTGESGTRHDGISEIIVPMTCPGIEVRPIKDMTANSHFCEVFFDDVRVPVENLVGAEGAAFKQAMRQLEHERGGIDRLVSNFLAYRTGLEHADVSNPIIRQQIASLEAGYRIGRLMVIREVLSQAPLGFSAATKTFCTEHEQRVAQFVWEALGATGMMGGPVTQGLTYSQSYLIMGGTVEILRNIVAERILGLPRGDSS